jgi:hypothetical protein
MNRRDFLKLIGAGGSVLALSPIMQFRSLSTFATATTRAKGFHVYHIDSRPSGQSYSAWFATWWKWICSLPKSEHPMFDKTGEIINKIQPQKNVFFLASTSSEFYGSDSKVTDFHSEGGHANRICSTGGKKIVLIPLMYSFDEDFDEANDSTADIELSLQIDDIEISLQDYKITSSEVQVSYHKDSPFLGDVGTKLNNPYTGTVIGYMVMVSLDPGDHTIHFTVNSTRDPPLHTNVKYQISI